MPNLRFRLPGAAHVLGDWLSRLIPELDRVQRRRWVEAGRVRVAGERVDRANLECAPGAQVEIDEIPAAWLPRPSARQSACWYAWVDEPGCFGGSLELAPRRRMDFRVEQRSAGLALLSLHVSGSEAAAAEVVTRLASAGLAVVGDLTGGGLARPGGPAIATHPLPPMAFAELDGPPWPDADSSDSPLVLRVSDEAARAVARGHPWVLPDSASDRARDFRPGSLVRVEARAGDVLGWAWTEADARISARMAAHGPLTRRELPSIEARVARALGRRGQLLAPLSENGRTDCHRLIHGEADGLPGLFVDRLGPLLRVLVTGRASDGFRERAVEALCSQRPTTPEGAPWSVLELLHWRTEAERADRDRVRWIRGGPRALEEAGALPIRAGFWVEERGLRFAVEPGWDATRLTRPGFGLFADQRDNRARLAPLAAAGGRWLNLFAHTGAFSVSLLAAGAGRVVSVDLSAAYLERLGLNLLANRERGVDPGLHDSVRIDGRRYLESLDPGVRFRGIVLDPPAAAAAGRRFWSVKQDLEPLLRAAIGRLEEAGVLLVTQNRRGARLGLEEILERNADLEHRKLRDLASAGPGLDFPSLAGFPEGDAFEGCLLTLE